jgi:hypothetical protein
MLGLLSLVACSVNSAPVPVIGTEAHVIMLAGEWAGEYQSPETGRSGSIVFRLAAGRDTAFGDVIMVPRAALPQSRGHAAPDARSGPQVLTIKFVRIVGNTVSGTIEPYQSPSCECLLLTVFTGELSGDRITGEFSTRHSRNETLVQKGTWSATRKRDGR